MYNKRKLIKNYEFIIKLIISNDKGCSVIGEKILTKEKYDFFKKIYVLKFIKICYYFLIIF